MANRGLGMLELYEQLEAPSDQELIALKEMHLDLDSHVLESLGCDGDMAADVRRPENRGTWIGYSS